MGKIADTVKERGTLLSDGGWGTLLQERGMEPGECPELWNDTHRDDVYDIAFGYITAGSDLIETNSFGGSSFKLEKYGLADRVFELNRLAAEISREAADSKFVLGSVGPTGKILMMGDVSEDQLFDAFCEQMRGLEAGGADAIMIETMSDLDEAVIAVKAAKSATQLEVFCTMTFEKTVQGDYRSMMGVSPLDMIKVMKEAGADMTGANCGNGMAGMIDIIKEIRSVDKITPLIVHANAGLPIYSDGKTIFPETAEDMAAFIPAIVDAGVNIIGGCCGTTPRHIEYMRAEIDRLKSR